MAEDAKNDSQTAIKIIERVPKAGYEDRLEKVFDEFGAAMRQSPGYKSSHVIRPSPPEQQAYRIVCLFDSEQHLRAWEASDVHAKLIEVANQFTEGEPHLTWLTGLETWFTLPASANVQGRPPAYKMAITTYVALFPTIEVVRVVMGFVPGFGSLPALLEVAVAVAIVVALMTYVIMPRFIRLLAFWLYPNRDRGH